MVDCFTSTAAVYRSKEGRRFALKIIRKQRLSAEQEIALEAEVELLRKIRHPGLVQTVDELDTPNEWFFIVELFAVCIYIYRIVHPRGRGLSLPTSSSILPLSSSSS